MNNREKETLLELIKQMDKLNITYLVIKDRLIINHHTYTIDYNVSDGVWHLNNNKKQKTMKVNRDFWSFWNLALQLIRNNYLALDIFFE